MFDYPHLEVLLAVEREGNLERAARSQQVTKSALSQTLSLLEQRMGAVTLDRNTMQPTQFGARLCRHLEHVTLLEQSFFASHKHLFDIEEPDTLPLRIAVTDDALASRLTDVVCQLDTAATGLLLDIELLKVTDAAAAMDERRISGLIAPISVSKPGYTVIELATHTMRAVASKSFVRRYFPDDVIPDALLDAPMARYAADDEVSCDWLKKVFGNQQSVRSHIIPSAHGIANACVDGTAWALCPDLLIQRHLASGTLVEIFPGSEITQKLYWHVSDHVLETFEPITSALRSAGVVTPAVSL